MRWDYVREEQCHLLFHIPKDSGGLDDWSSVLQQIEAEWLGLVNEDCGCCVQNPCWDERDFISKRTLRYNDDGDAHCSCVCHGEVK